MEEFNKMFEDAQKAKMAFPDAMKKLKELHKKVKSEGKKHISDEQLKELDKAVKMAEQAKKQLDEYNNSK